MDAPITGDVDVASTPFGAKFLPCLGFGEDAMLKGARNSHFPRRREH
jgi:hypothetical protein